MTSGNAAAAPAVCVRIVDVSSRFEPAHWSMVDTDASSEVEVECTCHCTLHSGSSNNREQRLRSETNRGKSRAIIQLSFDQIASAPLICGTTMHLIIRSSLDIPHLLLMSIQNLVLLFSLCDRETRMKLQFDIISFLIIIIIITVQAVTVNECGDSVSVSQCRQWRLMIMHTALGINLAILMVMAWQFVIAAECDVYFLDICGGAMQLMEMCVDCNDDWLCCIQCSVSLWGCLIAHSVLAHWCVFDTDVSSEAEAHLDPLTWIDLGVV